MVIINVLPLSQKDPRWIAKQLGTVKDSTIGVYGCIVTCMAMLATLYKHQITPDQMNDWLIQNNGYTDGFGGYAPKAQANLYVNYAFQAEFPDCVYDGVITCRDVAAPLDKIDEYLNAGRPVVVMVDFDHDPSDGIQTHFVLLVGKNDQGHYICNDPWFGDQADFNLRYGQDPAVAIQQINFFSGPNPQATPPPVAPAPPAPEAPVVDDKFKYDFGGTIGVQEMGAVRSIINDQRAKIDSQTKAIDSQTQAIHDLTVGSLQQASIIGELQRQIEGYKVIPPAPVAPDLRPLLGQIHDVLWGSGWWWTKVDKIKVLLPY